MKKELMYVAPEAEVLVAQVEKGFEPSDVTGGGNAGGSNDGIVWE